MGKGNHAYAVFINGVDRNMWMTISKIAVPLDIGTALIAEVVGVCVFTGILYLVLNKKFQSEW